MKKVIALILVIIAFENLLSNDNNDNNGKWSAEYSIGGTIFEIYAAQVLYKISDNSQIIFGPCFQNYKNDQGRANAYTFLIGYRHTFLKNITIDYELFPAYNEFESSIDGEIHKGYEVYSELRPGYKINFSIGKTNLYILPQLTIGYGIWTNNKWPDFDKQPNPALMGNLWFGIDF
jgi:hypothetical protein